MSIPYTEEAHCLEESILQDIAPLLSEESYNNLCSEIKRLKINAPPASGIGVDHIHYVPGTIKECQEQVKRLQGRMKWNLRLCFLYEITQRDAQRRIRVLEKENQQLKDETKLLKDELKRAHGQLHTVLGIKKSQPQAKEHPDNLTPPKGKKRGAPVGHIGRTRPIPEKADPVEIIPPRAICPHCGDGNILIDDDFISKFIEDIPPIVKTVAERRYVLGRCAKCGKSIFPQQATNGPPVVVGKNLVALLTIMRQQMGVSYRKLSKLCTETLKIPLSPSGVLGIINRVSQKLEPVYTGIESSLRTQAVLHGDETGWRMDGQRWYLWCFCNKQMVYFHPDSSRASRIPKTILGTDYTGILHADFYAAYNFLPKTQRCLVHFQRDIHDELEITPDDKILLRLKDDIKNIIKNGKELQGLPDSKEKQTQRKTLEYMLQKLAQQKSCNKKTQNLINRIARYKDDLLRFIDHPDAEYHNNRAERALRPAVIFRKISFGNRTPAGAQSYATIASVLETGRLQNKNLPDFIQSVWTTPTDQLHLITRSLIDSS